MTYIRQSTHKGAKVSCIDEDGNWDEQDSYHEEDETDNSDNWDDLPFDIHISDFYA